MAEATGNVIKDFATDSFSAYLDYAKQKNEASIQTRLVRAQGEQDRLTKMVELQYQNRGAPVDVRTNPTTTGSAAASIAALPTWAKVGLGVLALGAGAFVVAKLAG